MTLPCNHVRPQDGCRSCWLVRQPGPVGDKYRLAWVAPFPYGLPESVTATPPAPRLLPCVKRGDPTGATVVCPSCRGTTRLKLFACEIHDACTIDRKVEQVQCCVTCPDYEAAPYLPGPQPYVGDSNVKWAYGVTTVPVRRDNLLPRTLKSLKAGGFDSPRLFVDGDDDLKSWKREFGLEVTCRSGEPAKVVAHWILSMLELYHRDPLADRYAVFQDDLVTYPHLKDYLSHSPYPDRGYLNLFTFPQNQTIAPNRIGWFEGVLLNGNTDPKRFQKGLGAVALVFSNEALRTLFLHPGLFDKPKHASYGKIKIDGGIVNAMNLQGWREYVHNPSLVQHTGAVSSREESLNRHPDATSFLGENFDARSLLDATTRRSDLRSTVQTQGHPPGGRGVGGSSVRL